MKKIILIIAALVASLIFLIWLFIASNKPLPGISELQDGRNHIPEGSKTNYKFNPPTAGDHYPSWITKGFYDEPRPDGNLVHSLEHGYIVLWYDCENKVQSAEGVVPSRLFTYHFSLKNFSSQALLITSIHAQTMGMTTGSEGSPSAKLSDLPKAFSDGSCDNLKNQIKSILNQDQHKLIAVPRVGLDAPLILTAWGRAEKLTSVDTRKIKDFISAFRDNGPEHTDEP
jgi:hypothetical protein